MILVQCQVAPKIIFGDLKSSQKRFLFNAWLPQKLSSVAPGCPQKDSCLVPGCHPKMILGDPRLPPKIKRDNKCIVVASPLLYKFLNLFLTYFNPNNKSMLPMGAATASAPSPKLSGIRTSSAGSVSSPPTRAQQSAK